MPAITSFVGVIVADNQETLDEVKFIINGVENSPFLRTASDRHEKFFQLLEKRFKYRKDGNKLFVLPNDDINISILKRY